MACLKALSLEPYYGYFIQHHWLTFHFFADDTQLYISFSPNNGLELASTIAKIQDCSSDLDRWMSLNKLKLNKDKTELLYLYSKHCSVRLYHHFVLEVIQFIHPTQPEISRCDLWQHYLYALSRVNSLCKTAFYHLPNISCIRKFLSLKTTEILAHASVSFKLDYCNSLLYNVPKYILKKLQSVEIAAARLITCSRKYDHITPVLLDLHRLPVNE